MATITKSGCIIRENHEIALNKKQLTSFQRLLELAKRGLVRGINIHNPR